MSLTNKGVSGAKWTTLSSGCLAIVQMLKISVLARFLETTDFGLMAIIVFVVNFLNLFTDLGLSSAILHKKEISTEQYSSLYWLNIILSITIFVLIYATSPIISSFYNEPRLASLIPITGSGILLVALGKQHKTVVQKKLGFKELALVDIFSSIMSLFLAIGLAVSGYGIYSLIFGTLFQQGASNLYFLTKYHSKHRIMFSLDLRQTRNFLKIGGYQTGGQIVNYFNRDIDLLIIGKVLGSEALGAYNLAKQLVFRPMQILNPILTRVAPSLLSKLQDDLPSLRKAYLRIVNATATINIPVYLVIILFTTPIVTILYGHDYSSIYSVVKILAIYMIIRSIGNPIGSLAIATGRTDLEFHWNLIVLATMPLAVWAGSPFDLIGIAWAILLCRIALFVPSWYFLVWKLIRVPLKEYLKSLIPEFRFYYNLLTKKN